MYLKQGRCSLGLYILSWFLCWFQRMKRHTCLKFCSFFFFQFSQPFCWQNVFILIVYTFFFNVSLYMKTSEKRSCKSKDVERLLLFTFFTPSPPFRILKTLELKFLFKVFVLHPVYAQVTLLKLLFSIMQLQSQRAVVVIFATFKQLFVATSIPYPVVSHCKHYQIFIYFSFSFVCVCVCLLPQEGRNDNFVAGQGTHF